MADLATYQAAAKVFIKEDIFTLVDFEDLEKISKLKLKFNTGYAAFNIWNKEDKTCPTIGLHRFIMNAPKGMEVDHINGNRLDNRKINLRICTRSENSKNIHHYSKNKYKGVLLDTSRLKRTGRGHSTNIKYRAQIVIQGKLKHLGYFDTEENGALAYNKAAKFYFGKFANLNKVII